MEERLPADFVDSPLTQDELETVINEHESGEQAWQIETKSELEWAMRHYADAATKLVAAGEQAQEWKRPIDDWLVKESAPHRRDLNFFEHHITDFMLRSRQLDPEVKSIPVPSGTAKSSGRKPVLNVSDDARLIGWLQTQIAEGVMPDGLMKQSVRVSDLRAQLSLKDGQVVTPAGELIDPAEIGLCVEPETVSASVSVPNIDRSTLQHLRN